MEEEKLKELEELWILDDPTITIWVYEPNEITSITEFDIAFSDGRVLNFEECKKYFPYGDKYVGARFPPYFWQFFTENDSVVVICDTMELYLKILTNIRWSRSFDLS